MQIAESYSFPDSLYVCLTDADPQNPVVYGTDHEQFFIEITAQGTLEEFFNSFLTQAEFLALVERGLTK